MPVQVSYPGVYIQEIPSGVRTITAVSTSNTAFVDLFARGPVDTAVRISSVAEFERIFGGLHPDSEASYGIMQYFLNGGSTAWVVRVTNGAVEATHVFQGGSPPQDTLIVAARNPGEWGNNLQVAVDYNTRNPQAGEFNLVIRELGERSGKTQVVNSEVYRNLTMNRAAPRYAVDVVNSASSLVTLSEADGGLGHPPLVTGDEITVPDNVSNVDSTDFVSLSGGDDGAPPGYQEIAGRPDEEGGIYTLNRIAPAVFNIMCLPAVANLDQGQMNSTYTKALAYCAEKRAFLIVDIPSEYPAGRPLTTKTQMLDWKKANSGLQHTNSAVYFPRLEVPDPLREFRARNVGSSGTLASIYARTDVARGVWKAPAGINASIRGANVVGKINDADNGVLNMQGINVLRTFPVYGNISWGARTLEGADLLASEWKYIPVRRTALFIEETLYQNLKWAVFEPNDEPLWAQIRLAVGAFMGNLYRQGAFQGTSAGDAYFVQCDSTTTTQLDIDSGIVNIRVGFAQLKPAEFVVISIQQIAGQSV
jgi:phage tail sheath protein FI